MTNSPQKTQTGKKPTSIDLLMFPWLNLAKWAFIPPSALQWSMPSLFIGFIMCNLMDKIPQDTNTMGLKTTIVT